MLLERIFDMKDFQKITKKLSRSIIKQRWIFILGFVIYVFSNQSYICIEEI
jgi:hypothetical protein